MVCPRCITAVEHILSEQGIEATHVRLGEVELAKELSESATQTLSEALKATGFELLDDQRMHLIEQIKGLLIQKVQSAEIEEHFSVSKYLSVHIFKDYSAMSKLFSAVEGITIEQFFILQKIEKTKELLIYNERSLSQIAFDLGYSSPQHLSNQFKKLTGMTPSQFKQLGAIQRKPLDGVKG